MAHFISFCRLRHIFSTIRIGTQAVTRVLRSFCRQMLRHPIFAAERSCDLKRVAFFVPLLLFSVKRVLPRPLPRLRRVRRQHLHQVQRRRQCPVRLRRLSIHVRCKNVCVCVCVLRAQLRRLIKAFTFLIVGATLQTRAQQSIVCKYCARRYVCNALDIGRLVFRNKRSLPSMSSALRVLFC